MLLARIQHLLEGLGRNAGARTAGDAVPNDLYELFLGGFFLLVPAGASHLRLPLAFDTQAKARRLGRVYSRVWSPICHRGGGDSWS